MLVVLALPSDLAVREDGAVDGDGMVVAAVVDGGWSADCGMMEGIEVGRPVVLRKMRMERCSGDGVVDEAFLFRGSMIDGDVSPMERGSSRGR